MQKIWLGKKWGFAACVTAAAIPLFPTMSLAADETPQATPALATNLEPRLENGKQIFEASQFARFAPATALDMARQIPGFTITDVSADRGLGEATQNVLINGARVSGKSNDAATALSRIPASSVIRIEIVDGATLNIAGLSGKVLNLISVQGGIKGNFAYRPQFRSRIDPNWLNGEINISGKLGKADFTLGLANVDSFRGGGWGPEYNRAADGTLLYTRDRFSHSDGDRPRLVGTYSRKGDNGSLFNLNLAGELYYFRGESFYDRYGPAVASSADYANDREDEWNYEASTDYEFGVGKGRLKLVGFHRYEHSPFKSLFRRDYDDGSPSTGSRYDQVVDEGESVVRAEYKWKSGKADWQISAEGAYNYLDAATELYLLDSAGVFQPEPLPNATSRVTEKRGQVILSYGRPLTSNLTMQTQIGGEYSVLSQTGPNGLTRNFFRPKGLVSLAWKASPKLDVSFRLQRKVGQLNFGDFLASVDLQNSNNNAGNPQLVPPQSWLALVDLNRSFGRAGSLRWKIEAEAISDIVDQIPVDLAGLPPGNLQGEAPGNIDSAWKLRSETTASFLLDTIGFKGAKLDLTWIYQRTGVRDPITGRTRPISARGRYYWAAGLRHDIPGTQWAWGLSAENNDDEPYYRLDLQTREYKDGPFTLAYIEHKDVFGLKVRAQLMNLVGQTEKYSQIFYQDRKDGPVDFTRDGTFNYGLIYRVQVSGTF